MGPRPSASLLPLALLALLGACGDDEATPPTTTETPAPEPAIATHGGAEEVAAEVPEEPLATMGHTVGDVQVGTSVLRADMPVERGEHVHVGPLSSADLDLREGVRIALEAGTELTMGDIGPTRVLFAVGAAHIANPPQDGPRAVIRIATPEATIAISGPGEAYVVVHPSGTTVVMALAGLFTVSTGETDARGRLREVDLSTGHSVVVGARSSEPVDGPQRLDEARPHATALLAAATPVDDARRRHDLGTAITRLDESLGTLEAEARRGGELTEQHRAAVAAANENEAMRLQGELVAHSTTLFRLREVATSRWERVRVLALTVSERLEPDPIAVRAERVHGLLGE